MKVFMRCKKKICIVTQGHITPQENMYYCATREFINAIMRHKKKFILLAQEEYDHLVPQENMFVVFTRRHAFYYTRRHFLLCHKRTCHIVS